MQQEELFLLLPVVRVLNQKLVGGFVRELRLSWFVSVSLKDTLNMYDHVDHQVPISSF